MFNFNLKIVVVFFLIMITMASCGNEEDISVDIDTSEKIEETEKTGEKKIEKKITGNTYENWEEVVKDGKNKTVTFYMWSGNKKINEYIDNYVAKKVKEKYNITLKRVSMDAGKYIPKLLEEKEKKVEKGKGDLIWINAESFKNCKQSGLIWGPFTEILQNQKKYFDKNALDVNYDTGLITEGYEALWGKSQLILNYNNSKIKDPPKSYKTLLTWAKKNKGKFTYPSFIKTYEGKSFVRNSYYELTDDKDIYKEDISKEEFVNRLTPVKKYFDELKTYSWKSGKQFPQSLKEMDELFRNEEIIMSMSFDMFKTKIYTDKKIFQNSTANYVFDTGEITYPHYLAIPFNAEDKAASILVIDFLQSPEAQIEKVKGSVWGDLPALDVNKLNKKDRNTLSEIEKIMKVDLNHYNKKSLPEMKLEQIEWFNDFYLEKDK
ncbi:MAG: ABC transporter substrate-binding protein [Clostridiales bacterium]